MGWTPANHITKKDSTVAKKAHPEKVNPDWVAMIINSGIDRMKGYSQYIIMHYRATGNLAPGCDARDFYAVYDEMVKTNGN